MRQQKMEALLREIQVTLRPALKDERVPGDIGLDLKHIIEDIDAVLDRSPSGGKVDAGVSNTPAARRPGSNPGTGTITCGCGSPLIDGHICLDCR